MSRHELDVKRLLCPMPVIRLQSLISTCQPGDEIVLRCTDPGVRQDVPAWCRVHGHQVLSIEEDEGTIVVRVLVQD